LNPLGSSPDLLSAFGGGFRWEGERRAGEDKVFL